MDIVVTQPGITPAVGGSVEDVPEGTAEPGGLFDDGQRRIDFVLVYEHSDDPGKNDRRTFYHQALQHVGLELEQDVVMEKNKKLVFVKIHAPWNLLCNQAEVMKLKMPLIVQDAYGVIDESYEDMRTGKAPKSRETVEQKTNVRNMVLKNLQLPPQKPLVPVYRRRYQVTAPFRKKKIQLFYVGADRDQFFSQTQRAAMVWHLLQQTPNHPKDEKVRGLELLFETQIYDSAFQLHDSDLSSPAPNKDDDDDDDISPHDALRQQKNLHLRRVLRRDWANWRKAFTAQPIHTIRRYYGEKIAFYFAFLGFYTYMLVFPGLAGLCAFIYGFAYKGDDDILDDICDRTRSPGNWTACPICEPPNCEFDQIADSCSQAVWSYRNDNEATLVLCLFTVVWATVFRKLWKRREATLAFEWDTYDAENQQEDEPTRPDYERLAPMTRQDPVTEEWERYMPKRTRVLRHTASTLVTVLMLCLVGAALGCVVVARIALYGAMKRVGFHENVEWSRWLVHGVIFVVVKVFELIYDKLARRLTSLECPRTESEWLSSLLWKVFIFQLVNDIVPIAYAAWIKGNTITTPLELSWVSELCGADGCLSEVTELIAVLILARLVIGNTIELGLPMLKMMFSRLCGRRNGRNTDEVTRPKQWLLDYRLDEMELDGVSDEYMEMLVQFAFITLFTPALPAAPLVCLLNNIVEIRVDAMKFTVSTRRPAPIRVPGIEIWNHFLDIISKSAVICNAALIAFTSDILPRIYYKYVVASANISEASDPASFHKFMLASIPVGNWPDEIRHELEHEADRCYYRGFRRDFYPFAVTQDWWEVSCVRVITFSVFVLAGYIFQFLCDSFMSDFPTTVYYRIQRRKYVLTKTIEAAANAKAASNIARSRTPDGKVRKANTNGNSQSEAPRAVKDENGEEIEGLRVSDL